jgi:hypothetical protein
MQNNHYFLVSDDSQKELLQSLAIKGLGGITHIIKTPSDFVRVDVEEIWCFVLDDVLADQTSTAAVLAQAGHVIPETNLTAGSLEHCVGLLVRSIPIKVFFISYMSEVANMNPIFRYKLKDVFEGTVDGDGAVQITSLIDSNSAKNFFRKNQKSFEYQNIAIVALKTPDERDGKTLIAEINNLIRKKTLFPPNESYKTIATATYQVDNATIPFSVRPVPLHLPLDGGISKVKLGTDTFTCTVVHGTNTKRGGGGGGGDDDDDDDELRPESDEDEAEEEEAEEEEEETDEDDVKEDAAPVITPPTPKKAKTEAKTKAEKQHQLSREFLTDPLGNLKDLVKFPEKVYHAAKCDSKVHVKIFLRQHGKDTDVDLLGIFNNLSEHAQGEIVEKASAYRASLNASTRALIKEPGHRINLLRPLYKECRNDLVGAAIGAVALIKGIASFLTRPVGCDDRTIESYVEKWNEKLRPHMNNKSSLEQELEDEMHAPPKKAPEPVKNQRHQDQNRSPSPARTTTRGGRGGGIGAGIRGGRGGPRGGSSDRGGSADRGLSHQSFHNETYTQQDVIDQYGDVTDPSQLWMDDNMKTLAGGVKCHTCKTFCHTKGPFYCQQYRGDADRRWNEKMSLLDAFPSWKKSGQRGSGGTVGSGGGSRKRFSKKTQRY